MILYALYRSNISQSISRELGKWIQLTIWILSILLSAPGTLWTTSTSSAVEAQTWLLCAHNRLVSTSVQQRLIKGYSSSEDSACWRRLNRIAIDECQISFNKSTIESSRNSLRLSIDNSPKALLCELYPKLAFKILREMKTAVYPNNAFF